LDKVRVGIIGAGNIAQIAHIPSFKKARNCELIALADPNETKLKHLGERYGIPHLYTDYHQLISSKDVDAAVICTPTHMHAPLALEAFENGKHVFSEKPLAMDAAKAEELVLAAKKVGKTLMVGLNYRFRPDAQLLKRLIDEGEIGDVYYIKAGWLQRMTHAAMDSWKYRKKSAGGGAILNLAVHMIELILWLVDKKNVVAVDSLVYKRSEEEEVEDSAFILLKFNDGSSATAEVSWTLVYEKDLVYTNVFGTQGAALLYPFRIHKLMLGNPVNVTPQMRSVGNPLKVSYDLEASHFVDCIRKGERPYTPGEEGVQIAKITDAAYESSRTRREVRFD
jgi:predicted dehydrogenase